MGEWGRGRHCCCHWWCCRSHSRHHSSPHSCALTLTLICLFILVHPCLSLSPSFICPCSHLRSVPLADPPVCVATTRAGLFLFVSSHSIVLVWLFVWLCAPAVVAAPASVACTPALCICMPTFPFVCLSLHSWSLIHTCSCHWLCSFMHSVVCTGPHYPVVLTWPSFVL